MASRKKKIALPKPEQLSFADVEKWAVPPVTGNCVEVGRLPSPIWTETKAQLIRNYLKLFLLITHHGAYIDGFAGPQDPGNPESWAAKLVLELKPTWMNSFYLCEWDSASYGALASLVEAQPKVRGRQIEYKNADFNHWIDIVLRSGRITEKTATFALLDQRATECNWATVQKIAAHKKQGKKIELFYFFPTGWVHRSVSETKDKSKLRRWWGDDSWQQIPGLRQDQAASLCSSRIQALGYRDVKYWPISSLEGGEGRTMYHMIHATDHTEAPQLMYRAYWQLIGTGPGGEQSELDLRRESAEERRSPET